MKYLYHVILILTISADTPSKLVQYFMPNFSLFGDKKLADVYATKLQIIIIPFLIILQSIIFIIDAKRTTFSFTRIEILFLLAVSFVLLFIWMILLKQDVRDVDEEKFWIISYGWWAKIFQIIVILLSMLLI